MIINIMEIWGSKMRVNILFPGQTYSIHKAKIAKLRKIVGCAEKGCWTGSSWVSKDLVIETDFAKAAQRLGIPREYDGDVLVLSGAEDLCELFIKAAPDWGAELEFPEIEAQGVIFETDHAAPIKWFESLAASRGFDEKFISGWKKLMQIDIDNGNIPVTS